MTEEQAAQYEKPFEYVRENVRPARLNSRQPEREKQLWWIYTRSRPEMRAAVEPLSRYIATPMVAKHRIFVWFDQKGVPANLINIIARQDDYFFGVLHSRLHEVWSLRMGTSLEDRPRYTPTTTFETFPFPWPPGQEPADDPRYQAIASAAAQLHAERDAWLHPAGDVPPSALKQRTLTNLYNALNVYRGRDAMKIKKDAGDFAPRLAELHDALDAAVCAAYGWPVAVLGDEEEMLRRLLALNLGRAEQQE
jgi:hypothetical protein